MKRTYGYIRISHTDQCLDRQRDEMLKIGIPERDIFEDKASGKDTNREQYQILRKILREGDLLVIKSIDRLGRNYDDLLNEWRYITNEVKADIKVLDMPLLDTTNDTQGLIGKVISDVVLQLLSFVAEQERTKIKERQAEGIASAKARGKRFGRPKLTMPDNFQQIYSEVEKGHMSAVEAMKILGIKKTAFYEFRKILLNNHLKICCKRATMNV